MNIHHIGARWRDFGRSRSEPDGRAKSFRRSRIVVKFTICRVCVVAIVGEEGSSFVTFCINEDEQTALRIKIKTKKKIVSTYNVFLN